MLTGRVLLETIVITVGGVDTYYDYDECRWKYRRLGGGPMYPEPIATFGLVIAVSLSAGASASLSVCVSRQRLNRSPRSTSPCFQGMG
ncbi:hypothetical protein E0H75_28920 [Kribbella capetownensis]|uniref:Uncharacterized protein n=1 Tax=Kribbella capetownensis TaxID=1572659 RepID=A0A4R0JLN8_9ACTN|nr:hypothetical protein E0H75_28920 [Kribbella capetownensis]